MGWFNSGYTVIDGDGKRAAFDSTPLISVKFVDSSGACAAYELVPPFVGWSILGIIQDCMGNSRSNDGTPKWLNGHCVIGILQSSSSTGNWATDLRIGVGDGGSDALDWALSVDFPGHQF